MISSNHQLESLVWDIIAAGHSHFGNRIHMITHTKYIKALLEALATTILAGKTLNEMKASIRLDEFKEVGSYEKWLPLNVEGVYNHLTIKSGIWGHARGKSHLKRPI